MTTQPPAPPLTRRRLFGKASQMASLAAAASLMPPNVQKLMAAPMKGRRSLKDIKHVVMLMQENRSFDHYFGSLSGVRGFGDPDALTLSSGRSVFHQPDDQNPQGYLLPFHLDTMATNAQAMPSTSHAWTVQHRAWNGGKMDQWVKAHRAADLENGPYTMGYFKREDIPFHYALAEAFTICDAYHSSVMGPTRPNRLYWMTGTIDPEGRYGVPIIKNPDIEPGSRKWTTYPERLEAAGISWKVYQHASSAFAMNLLHGFDQFENAPKTSALWQKGVSIASEGQFEYDAMNDRLPAVSWICPPETACEHPANSGPAAGAEFIASKLNAIAANPDVWAKTVFILNYDENDGLFDHVPPPIAPPGAPHEYIDGVPIGAGFRVPCIIVSPWTAGGRVCSELFDHTSILQFLERVTGVREPNIGPWRRRTFGDLTSVFGFDAPAAPPPVLPDTGTRLHLARYAVANLPPPALTPIDQMVPEQERGTRPRIPEH